MEFGFKITKKDSYSLIKLNGNLIEKNQANSLMDEIDAHPDGEHLNYVIDLSAFQYMNSTGLNVLLNILSKARKSGGEAVICLCLLLHDCSSSFVVVVCCCCCVGLFVFVVA